MNWTILEISITYSVLPGTTPILEDGKIENSLCPPYQHNLSRWNLPFHLHHTSCPPDRHLYKELQGVHNLLGLIGVRIIHNVTKGLWKGREKEIKSASQDSLRNKCPLQTNFYNDPLYKILFLHTKSKIYKGLHVISCFVRLITCTTSP